jgi:hypothetical protein
MGRQDKQTFAFRLILKSEGHFSTQMDQVNCRKNWWMTNKEKKCPLISTHRKKLHLQRRSIAKQISIDTFVGIFCRSQRLIDGRFLNLLRKSRKIVSVENRNT